jgi:hypothetical protein
MSALRVNSGAAKQKDRPKAVSPSPDGAAIRRSVALFFKEQANTKNGRRSRVIATAKV